MNNYLLKISRYFTTLFILLYAALASAIPISITSGETPSGYYEASGYIDYQVFNIGLYEPDNEHGWRRDDFGNLVHFRDRGTATIYIEEQNGIPAALVLGSYEPTDWILMGPGAIAIDSILLYGYHHHTISGMSVEANVEEYTYEGGNPYIYSSGAYNWPHASIDDIESVIGSPITSFVGAYSASEFLIGSNTSEVPEPSTIFLLSLGLAGLFLRKNLKC